MGSIESPRRSAVADAYSSDENPNGVNVGEISDCEYELLLMMNGKWVNIIEMLTESLIEKQTTCYTASSGKEHVHLFGSMVADLNFY